MRIAMISEHASPLAVLGGADAGGQNVHVAALSTHLAQRGHEVRVYTRRDDAGLDPWVPLAPGVDVVNVDDVTRDQHVERELLLIKLRAGAAQFAALQACVHRAGGKVLSDEAESFTVELTDSESQINKFIAEAGNLGEVLEVVRSGALAMLRGATTLRA